MRAPALPRVPAPGGALRAHALPLAVAAVCGLTVLVGWIARASGVVWGTPLQPFLGTRGLDVEWAWAPPALVVLGLCAWQAVRVAAPGHGSSRAFVLWALGLALLSRLALNTVRLGPVGWTDMFAGSPEANNEYLAALPATQDGLGLFLDRFAEWLPALPVHVAGHPPGLITTMVALGIDDAAGLSALIIGVGVLTAPLTYWVGRELADEAAARLATVLWIFAPSALLYGASAADALFATLGMAAAAVLVLRPPPGGERAARVARGTTTALRRFALPVGAALLAVASFFAWSLLGMAAFAAFVVLGRDGLRRTIVLGALCAGALVAFYAGLWALTGYDAIGSLRRVEEVYRFSVASVRPYAFWLFGSPAAFLIGAGLPVLWFAALAVQRRHRGAVAIAGVIVIASVLGFTKAETERIWLSFLPLACLAAATVLPRRWVAPALAVMVLQAYLTQVFVYTVW
ncbi:MAG: hypothetical protein M3459_01930 [Actinomycetota bacterium]|nr:hypothetical protein [Actinomycetota bacterium]